MDYVTSHEGQAGIIYCSTRKQVEELNEALENENVKSTIYHAGLTNKEREEAQNDFLYDRVEVCRYKCLWNGNRQIKCALCGSL